MCSFDLVKYQTSCRDRGLVLGLFPREQNGTLWPLIASEQNKTAIKENVELWNPEHVR